MRRAGYANDEIAAVKRAYRTLYRSKLRLEEAREAIREQAEQSPAVTEMLATLDRAERGIIR